MRKKTHIGYFILPIIIGIAFLLSDNSRFQQRVMRPALCAFLQKQNIDVEIDSLRFKWHNASIELFGVHAKDSLGNDYLSLGKADVDLQLLPIFWKEIQVRSLRLNTLHLNLSNLPTFQQTPKAEKQTKKAFLINLHHVVLTGSSMYYRLPSPVNEDLEYIEATNLQAKMTGIWNSDYQEFSIDGLSFVTDNGFVLDNLALTASLENQRKLEVTKFEISLPHSYLLSDSIDLIYQVGQKDSLQLLRDFCVYSTLSSEDFPTLSQIFEEADLTDRRADIHLHLSGASHHVVVEECKLEVNKFFALNGMMDIYQESAENWHIDSDWENIYVHTELVPYLQSLFPENRFDLPLIVENLERLAYSGSIQVYPQQLLMSGLISSAPGVCQTNVNLKYDSIASTFDCQAFVETPSLDLAQLLDNEMFSGNSAFNVRIDAKHLGDSRYKALAEAKLDRFAFNDYQYKDISLQADLDGKGLYKANIDADDDNCKLVADFQLDARGERSDWTLTGDFDQLNLQALHFLEGNEENAHLSFNLDAHMQGDTLERLIGSIAIDSLDFYHHGVSYQQPRIELTSNLHNDYAHVSLSSEQVNADVYGDMSLKLLFQEFNEQIASRYVPSLVSNSQKHKNSVLGNRFSFSVNLSSTEALAKAFSLPISVVDTAQIDGYYYDEKGIFALNVAIDSLRLQQQYITDSRLSIDNSGSDMLKLELASAYQPAPETDAFHLKLDAKALNDKVDMEIGIQLDNKVPFAQSHSSHQFYRDESASLACQSLLNIPYILWKDSEWQLDTTSIDYSQHKFYIHDFSFHHDDQFIRLDGCISDQAEDTLNVNISDIDLKSLTQLFPLKINIPKPMLFGASLSAKAAVRALLGEFMLDADVKAEHFEINNSPMGDLEATARWNNTDSCLEISGSSKNADMHTGAIFGEYHIAKDSLFLGIHSEGLPLDFISYFTDPMLDLSAHAYGDINIYGKPAAMKWDVEADAFVPDGELYSSFINTRYRFSDSIHLTRGNIHFNQIELFDEFNNTAILNGGLSHQNFLRYGYNLSLNMNRLHLMDLPASSGNNGFYGEIVASGLARMSGTDNDIQIDLDVRTEDHTNFFMTLSENLSEGDYSFIEFVKTDDRENLADKSMAGTTEPLLAGTDMSKLGNVSVSMELELTPAANLILVTNAASGDEMRMSGSGTLRMSYDNNQDLQLYGRYELEKGKYGFTFQDLIHRDFNILQGSAINFSGDVMSADLDIKANYSILNVELSDILDESDMASLDLNRTGIPVNCQMSISGELQQPEIVLGLEFPSADEELRRRIMNIINTDELLNRQIVYLLLLNRFAVTDNVQNADAGVNNMSAVVDLGLNSLSNQLNRMIYQVMGSDNLSLDLNYRYDDMAEGLGEWQVAMTGQLLDNRLSINGNIGSREDLVNDNTQFIGDFDLEYKFSQNGRWRLKVFNRSNDSRYFKSALNTQGAGLVYKETFNSFSELRRDIIERIGRQIKRSKAESDLPKRKKKAPKH